MNDQDESGMRSAELEQTIASAHKRPLSFNRSKLPAGDPEAVELVRAVSRAQVRDMIDSAPRDFGISRAEASAILLGELTQ
jgi:hypothetical protein